MTWRRGLQHLRRAWGFGLAGTIVAAAVGCGTGAAPTPPLAGGHTLNSIPALPLGASPPSAARDPRSLMEAEDVDTLLASEWAAAHVTPAPPASENEFLRRVTLDLVGRIPTVDEVEEYVRKGKPGFPSKQVRRVEALLDSAEHAEAWADVFVDLFVGKQFRKPSVTKILDPRAYFVEAIRQNRPFDRLATELLTFAGELAPNGPGAFLASHLKGGGPESAAAAAARLFLGVQLQCAQCHDHPYDQRYKQEDFYGLVAYFAGTKSRQRRGAEPAAEMGSAEPAAEEAAAPPMRAERVYAIIDRQRGPAAASFRRPGSTDDLVVPARFLGRDVPPLSGESPRQTLARAIIDSDLFAKAVVDRTWARLFGSGLVEPWDDLGGEHDPRHPELLDRLAMDFRRGGFDLRRLLRTLVLSRAYGLSSRTPAASPVVPRDEAAVAADGLARFSRGGVRRATPDQMFRSLLVATGVEHMERPGGEPMARKVERLMKEHLFVFGDDEGAEVDTFAGNIPQALLLWNGEIVNLGARARPGGVLAEILAASANADARLEQMYLATLSRWPTPAERARLIPGLTDPAAGTRAFEDLYFALLTSTEMLTNH